MSPWRDRAAATRFATLATLAADGSPHLVPIVHAVVGDRIVFAVDEKPKRTRRLARIRHIERDPRVSVLFDHRSDDWDSLWWVRADGVAAIHTQPPPGLAGALIDRHRRYRTNPPSGPWCVVTVHRWTGWSAA